MRNEHRNVGCASILDLLWNSEKAAVIGTGARAAASPYVVVGGIVGLTVWWMNPIEAGESEEDVKKAQKKWEEAEKSKGASEGKTKAEKERDELLDGAKDTTERKGKSKNYEKGGGNTKAQEDFDNMDLEDVKDINTKYGPGKVGKDSDGNTVIYRPGSSEGPPTLEIQLPGRWKIKIRY